MTEHWTERAACRGADISVFYPYGRPGSPGYERDVEAARAHCRGCPVVLECLSAALAEGDDHAVRGGSTPAQRRELHAGLAGLAAA